MKDTGEFYDAMPQREWERLDRHRIEMAVTLRAIREHLAPPPGRVLDAGGGPGRYAIELARQGYAVTLLDLSRASLDLARAKADEAGVSLAEVVQANALDLSRFAEGSFDGVLLLGPLYHLTVEEERVRALREALRVLRRGGTLFAAFLTRYAGPRWAAKHMPLHIVEHPEEWGPMLASGVGPLGAPGAGRVDAYWAHPTEVRPLVEHAGAEVVDVVGCEGIVSYIDEGVNALTGAAWEAWVDVNYRLGRDPSIHGAAEHLLAVARKPSPR